MPGTGAIVYGEVSFDKFTPTVAPERAAEVHAIQKKMQTTWKNGKNQIISEGKENITDWTFTDIRTLHEIFLPTLTNEEKSFFLEAFNGEEKRKNLEVGDFMPGLLFSHDRTEAKLYWQKKDESYVYISLKTRINEEGHKMCYVDGNARKLPKIKSQE
ncbi:hypothetical protein [Paenibacillus sp. LHD-38]|uniref:hypothetical protein n=1 Tax=Paenibacillus sp. LHD-38 TaxID=3072143 RepID=UPI00280CF454|nr:hypothetical protein [Paenibacillus sp. LHD-38]MDQ8738386.1 hypothetical protein [Paenibacillus sp. LHD-38]